MRIRTATALAALALGPMGFLLAAPHASAAPTTYYVDCATGDDTKPGTSTSQPWRTLAKVSNTTFNPGDRILLKRGTTCTGTLAPKGSGDSKGPISIDAYGPGEAKPHVAAGGAARAISLHNQQGWEIRNLEVSNTGPSAANRRAVSVTLEDYGTGSHFLLENLDIHDVNGDDTKETGGSGGIYFAVTGQNKKTNFDDVVIRKNTVGKVDREGIFMVSTWNRSGFEAKPQAREFAPWTKVVISGNKLTDIGGDGIVAGNTAGALVEGNYVNGFQKRSKGNNAGIWTFDSDRAVIQHNDVTGGATHRDGMAYDIDQGSYGTVFQYNYSHDNEGGFFLFCTDPKVTDANQVEAIRDGVVRYNISQNDHFRGFENCGGAIKSIDVYNNTLYVGDGVSQTVINENNTTRRNVTFRNNIVVKAGSGDASFNLQSGGYSFDSNVFHGTKQNPSDPHAVTGDPLLAAPGTATSASDANGYRLKPGSPAIGTGAAITDNGGRDYFGQNLPSDCLPDRGASQDGTCSKARPPRSDDGGTSAAPAS